MKEDKIVKNYINDDDLLLKNNFLNEKKGYANKIKKNYNKIFASALLKNLRDYKSGELLELLLKYGYSSEDLLEMLVSYDDFSSYDILRCNNVCEMYKKNKILKK